MPVPGAVEEAYRNRGLSVMLVPLGRVMAVRQGVCSGRTVRGGTQVKRIFGVLCLGSGVLVAACGSSGTAGSSASPSPHKTIASAAAEAITGSLASPTGAAPVVQVKATGAVTASGTVTLRRCALTNHYRCTGGTDITFTDGSLHIQYGKSTFTQYQDASTCGGSYANVMPYTITGGSGAYAGASGHGAAEIEFTATFSKVNGACDFAGAAKPEVGTAHLSFTANGPVTPSSASAGA